MLRRLKNRPLCPSCIWREGSAIYTVELYRKVRQAYADGMSKRASARHFNIARVPAAEIEAAVINQIRGLLRAPEVVVATWRAAQRDCEGLPEDEVREALAALDPLWTELFPAEQARIIQLLIGRVDIGTDGLKLQLRDKGLAQMVAEVGIMTGKSRREAE